MIFDQTGLPEDRQSLAPAGVVSASPIAPANETRPSPRPVIAELMGDSLARAGGHTAKGEAPVLELCRQLIAAGFNPDRPLLAYRGSRLAVRVRSLADGAALVVNSNDFGTPIFRNGRACPSETS